MYLMRKVWMNSLWWAKLSNFVEASSVLLKTVQLFTMVPHRTQRIKNNGKPRQNNNVAALSR